MRRAKEKESPVIIITGANQGIGFHMAVSLLRERYRVAALSRSGDNLVPLYDTFPDNLLFYQCDVTSGTTVRAAVDAVLKKWGRIDILVNNACEVIFGSFEEKTLEQIKREFEVNYFGYIRMIAAVLPHMKVQRGGIIHNVGSGVAITGCPNLYGYASTKGAVEALTRTLRLELARYRVYATIIYPPLTYTSSTAPWNIPAQAMADPAVVGRQLAGKILSTKRIINPNFLMAAFLFFARRYPYLIERMLSVLLENAREISSHNEA